VDGWPGQAAVARQLWDLAEYHTPRERVAEYNQAMMDLGATVCTRSNPDCDTCPLQERCLAHGRGEVSAYPAPRPQRRLPVRKTCFLMIHDGAGSLLLERRPPQGIWGGLWSFPECGRARETVSWCRERLGLQVTETRRFPVFRHTFSHFHLDIQPLELVAENPTVSVMEGDRLVWYKLTNPDPRGISAPVARLIAELRSHLTGEVHEPGSSMREVES
jgi:A/G-specific adenine glycosylase